MASKKVKLSPKASLPFKVKNKIKREDLFVKQKKAREILKREDRFRRKKEERKDPKLYDERIKRNVPLTLDRKRSWDQVDRDTEDGLGVSVDVERLKRQKLDEEAEEAAKAAIATTQTDVIKGEEDLNSDRDSMLESEASEDEAEDKEAATDPTTLHDKASIQKRKSSVKDPTERATSPTHSTVSTNLDLTPSALAHRFPSLFNDSDPARVPKLLITTSQRATIHTEAEVLTTLFPNSTYIPRSAHRYAHKYSVREIARFAAAREYTAMMVVKEDAKVPTGLSITNLPSGPTFHFSISNWVPGKKLPGHGRPTNHHPELILNNFRTPLGLLTATVFRTLFPPVPDFEGRQVVTLHNQRDYIFVRRHRYVFRKKRETEKEVVGSDGKVMKGAEGLRTGLQELGPRLTLKLRRVDKGVGRADGDVEWEWKGRMEKTRTKFQL
ncbi:hypothetical protein MMC25_000595 [Agyrium rufum]|nr:hypothetical protein [Agyrium rufum]